MLKMGLPVGMRYPKRPPLSSHKAYPFGQRSVHCRICCKKPDSSLHYQNPNNHCGGEFGVNGADKIACCPRCGTEWQSGFMTPAEMEKLNL